MENSVRICKLVSAVPCRNRPYRRRCTITPTSDEFAVHSDGIAFDVELHSLSPGDILETVFYQIYAGLIFVFRYAAAQR